MIGHGRPPPALLLVLLCLVAVNLRTVSIGVAPVLSLIRADLGISYAEAGILFALPVVLMGLGAEPAGRLADRLGTWRTIAAGLALLALGGGLRAAAPGYWALLLLTALYAAGIGLTQPSLPRVVREWFPLQRASATGAYTAGLILGAILAAAVTGPLLLAWLGEASWRGTCLVWAALTALSLIAWLACGPRRGPAARPPATARAAAAAAPLGAGAAAETEDRARAPVAAPPPRPPGAQAPARDRAAEPHATPRLVSMPAAGPPPPPIPIWRDRTAWLITLLFLTQGLTFYQLSGWLPTYYQELGFDLERAGQPLALLNIAMLPVCLTVTYLSDRQGRRRPFLVGASLLFLAGSVGLLLAPLEPYWLWSLAMGGGTGAIFSLALALPIDLLDPRRARATISLVFTVGYTGALASPLLAGALRDALGSFTLALVPTVAFGVAMLVLALLLPETGRGIHGPARR